MIHHKIRAIDYKLALDKCAQLGCLDVLKYMHDHAALGDNDASY